MAKDDRAKVKMTVIQFETESDNETLQENIKAIAQTLTRALGAPPRVVYAPQQITSGDGATPIPAEFIEEEPIEAEVTTPASPKKKGGAAPKYRVPKPVEIDLTTGEMPLKDFLEKKNPDGDIKRYLAIAYWLKKYRNIEDATADHVYTCYRHMGSGW